MTPVGISGMGTVSCLGYGTDALWNAILENKSGITTGLGTAPERPESEDPFARLSRASRFSMHAIREAMAQARWTRLTDEDGLILATTTGQISLWESEMLAFARKEIGENELSQALVHQPLGSLLETLGKELQFKGRQLLLTSACSASTQAIATGAMWIKQGLVRRCLVGGVEVLSKLTTEGFKSLQLLSEKPSMPFDRNRNGINLSEAAAFLCLEAAGPRSLAEISGWGFSSDAHHVTSPHPEGRGCFDAMTAALSKANLQAKDVSWIHCHGTGSSANDHAEGTAVHRLFGETRASSTKSIHGHALAASGTLESVICVKALQSGVVPATHGLTEPDPQIPLRHVRSNEPFELKHIVKNTLGFGGNNAALVFSLPRGQV